MSESIDRQHDADDRPVHARSTRPVGLGAHRPRGMAHLAVALLAVITAGCGDDARTDAATASSAAPATSPVDLSDAEWVDLTDQAEVTIQTRDNRFTPAYVIVKVRTPITFRNVGRTQHNALPVDEISFEGIEADEFEPQDEHTISFDEPGDYPYYCSLHGTTTRGMVGAIRVVA